MIGGSASVPKVTADPNTSSASLNQTPEVHEEARAAGSKLGSALVNAKQDERLDDKVAQDQQRRDDAARHRRAEAPEKASELTMGTHQRIVDHLFDLPAPMEVYERVRRGLSFGGRASTLGYGDLVDALDEAEQLAADASQLSANMKVALRAFELDADVIRGAIRAEARDDLQNQKDAKGTKGVLTIADIEAAMAAKYPDEYRDLELRHAKAKRSSDAIEQLSELARDRARDLRAMVAKARDGG